MKNIIQLLVFIIIALAFAINYSSDSETRADRAKRDLKLGNTYREGGEFDLAKKYLELGSDYFSRRRGFEAKYWNAVANEFYGYLYRDMAVKDGSKIHLEKSKAHFYEALRAYEDIIKQEDGSQYAINIIYGKIKEVEDMLGSFEGGVAMSETALSFDNMKLRDMPDGLPKSMENLSFMSNKFREFPSELCQYAKLKYLNLSDNRIREIPACVGDMKALHWLDLSGNKLKELPVEIGMLTNLKELNLENNKLKTLPASMCNLKNLRILNLRDNKLPFTEVKKLIKCLPETIIIHDEYEKKGEYEY